MRRRDISGEKFGHLTAKEFAYQKNRNTYWKCVCDCGNEKVVRLSHLLDGNAKSCGCKQRLYKHHQTDTRLYHIWCTMKARCLRETSPKYKNYGGRGIKLDEEWNDFEPFMSWSYSNGYADNLSIDRVDVNGNYEPSNCRWIPLKQQYSNKTNTVRVEIDGTTIPLIDLCDEYGTNYKLAYKRIRNGWNPVDALTIPSGAVQHKGCKGYAQWKQQEWSTGR